MTIPNETIEALTLMEIRATIKRSSSTHGDVAVFGSNNRYLFAALVLRESGSSWVKGTDSARI